jgi:hypothetical protein
MLVQGISKLDKDATEFLGILFLQGPSAQFMNVYLEIQNAEYQNSNAVFDTVHSVC